MVQVPPLRSVVVDSMEIASDEEEMLCEQQGEEPQAADGQLSGRRCDEMSFECFLAGEALHEAKVEPSMAEEKLPEETSKSGGQEKAPKAKAKGKAKAEKKVKEETKKQVPKPSASERLQKEHFIKV